MQLTFSRKKEAYLFLTFFIIYLFFIQSSSWNENAKLDLTRAIVGENRFEIDSFYNNTGDRSYYNEHYYSDKAPGQSILSVPFYFAWKNIYFNFLDQRQEDAEYVVSKVIINPYNGSETKTYELINLSSFDGITVILLTIFTASLPSALTVVLIYRISGYITKKETQRNLITIVYGLGTLAFIYGTILFTHALATFLIFLSFSLLFTFRMKKLEKKAILLSGLLAGFAVVVDYPIGPIALLLFFYTFAFKDFKLSSLFFIFMIVGCLPLFLYNFSIIDNPLKLVYSFTDPSIRTDVGRTMGFTLLPNPFIIYRHLFDTYRGLFFFHPILILSAIGFYWMLQKYKSEALLIILSFIGLLILFSMRDINFFDFGSSFGARNYLPIMPFLMLPLMFSIGKVNPKIFYLFLIISISINVIGLQNWDWMIGETYSVYIAEPYRSKVNSFEILANPLKDHYLPLFFKNGPRSRILEYLLIGELPDIRHLKPMPSRETKLFTLSPIGISVLKIPFLSIPILLIIITFIWIKELSKVSIFKKITSLHILLVLIVLLFASRLEFKEITYDKNWYPVSVNATHIFEEKWIKNEASVYYYSPKEETKNFLLEIGTFYKPREVEITVNEKLFNYTIFSHKEKIVAPSVKIKRGENVITFKSLSNCDKPYLLINTSEDTRCLSFVLHDIKGVSLPTKHNIIFDNNWYPEEQYITWSYKSPSLIIKSNEKSSAKLNLTLISYNKPRELGFVINDILFDIIRVETNRTNVITKTFPLKAGDNILKFIIEDCDIPAEIEKSNDRRCLSFGIISVELVSPFILDKDIIFGPNWYEEEKDGGRWMSNNGSIFLFSNTSRKAELSFDIATYKIDRTTRIYLNKDLIFEEKIKVDRIEKIKFGTNLKEGENLLEIENDIPCRNPALIEISKDDRCLSFKLFNLVVD